MTACRWCGVELATRNVACIPHPGELAKLAAIEAVGLTNAPYLDGLHRAIQSAALDLAYLTTDDVWDRLDDVDRPSEPRAMGAAMVAAAKLQIIERTGSFRQSTRLAAHRNPKRVWHSLIYTPVRLAALR